MGSSRNNKRMQHIFEFCSLKESLYRNINGKYGIIELI